MDEPAIVLCRSEALQERGLAVAFDVNFAGQTCRAFALRYAGAVYAYLNRCSHVAMEMDYQPNHFFDSSGEWLICATHGALYDPRSGACRGGPCRGGLVAIATSERQGLVYWHTDYRLQPVSF